MPWGAAALRPEAQRQVVVAPAVVGRLRRVMVVAGARLPVGQGAQPVMRAVPPAVVPRTGRVVVRRMAVRPAVRQAVVVEGRREAVRAAPGERVARPRSVVLAVPQGVRVVSGGLLVVRAGLAARREDRVDLAAEEAQPHRGAPAVLLAVPQAGAAGRPAPPAWPVRPAVPPFPSRPHRGRSRC